MVKEERIVDTKIGSIWGDKPPPRVLIPLKKKKKKKRKKRK